MKIKHLDNHDTYMISENVVDRLVMEYNEQGNLIVAVDFDSTIFPTSYNGMCGDANTHIHDVAVNLIKRAYSNGLCIMLFTARDPENVNLAVEYMKNRLGITSFFINEIPWQRGEKPFYNIFLEDRAGLKNACEDLTAFMDKLFPL